MLWLNREAVEQALDLAQLIKKIEAGFQQVVSGRIVNGEETRIDIVDPKSNFVAFPAVLVDAGIFSVKILTANDARLARGEPRIGALISIVDVDSGEALGVMDGTYITAARTAAITAVACRSLLPGEGGTLAIVGTGIVAKMHLRILPLVRRFERIVLASALGELSRAERLAAELAAFSAAKITCVADPATALSQADIAVTATNRTDPVASTDAFESVRLLAAVGNVYPGACEVPNAVLASSLLVADRPERFRRQWRNALPAGVLAAVQDLSSYVVGETREPSCRTVFCSGGLAFADGIAALLAYRCAKKGGLGQQIL